jgi:hypothetical protein
VRPAAGRRDRGLSHAKCQSVARADLHHHFVAGLGLAYANMSPASYGASVSIAVLSFIVASIVANAVKVADQWERVVVLSLGEFRSLEGPGLFFIVPILETVPFRIDVRVITSTFRADRR